MTLAEFAPVSAAEPGKQPLDSGHGRALLSIFVGAHETENTSCWSSLAGPARHTESKRPLVVLFTTAREMTQITSRLPSRILSEFNVKITAARADQRPLWQVT